MRIWRCVFQKKLQGSLAKSSFFTSKTAFCFTDYRLRPGLSLSSYGTNCAALSGVPREIIVRAELYSQLQSHGEDLVDTIRGESDEQEMRELKTAEQIAKRFITWDIDASGKGQLRSQLSTVLT